jgi:hypothetical protein
MKNFLLLPILLIYFISFENGIAQEKPGIKRNLRVYQYLVKDSLNSYIVRETNNPDGSVSYSIVPKSHIQEESLNENPPHALIEWFNKQKRTGKAESYQPSGIRSDTIGYLYTHKRFMEKDTIGTARNKKNTLWWIVGTTAVAGGVTAIIFLLTKKGEVSNVEELPIQPFPNK